MRELKIRLKVARTAITVRLRDVFRSPKFGAIAGCMVIEGVVHRTVKTAQEQVAAIQQRGLCAQAMENPGKLDQRGERAADFSQRGNADA